MKKTIENKGAEKFSAPLSVILRPAEKAIQCHAEIVGKPYRHGRKLSVVTFSHSAVLHFMDCAMTYEVFFRFSRLIYVSSDHTILWFSSKKTAVLRMSR